MEILANMPGITVSRYTLLNREPSPKRFYSPGQRDRNSSARESRKGSKSAGSVAENQDKNTEDFGDGGTIASSVPSTPLKSILKPVKKTNSAIGNDMQTLQVLLTNLNHRNTYTDRSNLHTMSPKRTQLMIEHFPERGSSNQQTKTLPPVVSKDKNRIDSPASSQRPKTVSFKLDNNAKSKQSKGLERGKGDWSVMVCSSNKSEKSSKNGKSKSRGVIVDPSPVFEEKPQSIRDVVMNEIKELYGRDKNSHLYRDNKSINAFKAIRFSPPNFSAMKSPSTLRNPEYNHLHMLGDPYRRFLSSRAGNFYTNDKDGSYSLDSRLRKNRTASKKYHVPRRHSYNSSSSSKISSSAYGAVTEVT